jgi:hypothetical protein
VDIIEIASEPNVPSQNGAAEPYPKVFTSSFTPGTTLAERS